MFNISGIIFLNIFKLWLTVSEDVQPRNTKDWLC